MTILKIFEQVYPEFFPLKESKNKSTCLIGPGVHSKWVDIKTGTVNLEKVKNDTKYLIINTRNTLDLKGFKGDVKFNSIVLVEDTLQIDMVKE